MGLFNFKKRSEETTTNTTTENEIVGDALLTALLNGEKISKQKALELPIVESSVDMISNTIAILPIYLYKETIKENKKQITKIENDERIKLLNDDTNDTLDGFQLKKALVQDYLLDKGGFAYINKKGKNFKSLNYVEPEQISYMKNFDPIFKDGTYLVNAKTYELYNFIALLRDTKDGIVGHGLIEKVSKAIETAYSNMLFELNLVQKGGVKKGFINSDKKLAGQEMTALKNAWRNMYSTNEENVMVLNNGIKFQEAGSTGVELQLNERKLTLNDEIKQIFHIDNKDTNKTIKEAIMPIIKAFETTLNKVLLLEDEKENYYFVFDTKELTKGSIKERYEAYKIAKDTGFITNNEIRYLEDMEQIEGLDTISFSLANVIYDTKTKNYYVPNTGATFTTLDEAIKSTSEGGDVNEDTNKE